MFDAIAPALRPAQSRPQRGARSAVAPARGRRAAAFAAQTQRVLDLCTGTADLAIAIATASRGCSVAGVDFSGAMLRLRVRRRSRRAELVRRIRLVRGDAARIPLADASCDAATIAFGIRNVAEPERRARGARPRPSSRRAPGDPRVRPAPHPRASERCTRGISDTCYRRWGGSCRTTSSAYSYLPASVGAFPPPAEFVRTIERHGFVSVKAAPLTLGIVYLYVATRRLRLSTTSTSRTLNSVASS